MSQELPPPQCAHAVEATLKDQYTPPTEGKPLADALPALIQEIRETANDAPNP